MEPPENTVQKQLFALQDKRYQAFQCRLMPTVVPDRVIGVRMPALRAFACTFAKSDDAERFLRALPHTFYEENNLHALCIAGIRDFDIAVEAVDAFLPFVDNWATCDLLAPKAFAKDLPKLLGKIQQWIGSDYTYTIRFGIGMLMRHFLDEQFQPSYLQLVAGIHSQEYYVNMMIAWYFATALAKQYDAALLYIRENRLGDWIHQKTIQKALESYRVTGEHKAVLKTMKRSKSTI